ncbi:MAG: hypothetical protein HC828_04030 [Blastochloris sp.]|nr:hypothetical protein [Blastochloris sp.]
MIDALKKGLARLRRLGRPDETTLRVGHEAQIKQIVDTMAEQLREDQLQPAGAFWIVRQRPDPEVFLAALLEVFDEAIARTTVEAATAAYQHADLECCCRCRAHHRVACPICVRYEACPLHADANPADLQPQALLNPRWVAEAVHRELTDLLPGVVEWTNPDLDSAYREALVEALARVLLPRAR